MKLREIISEITINPKNAGKQNSSHGQDLGQQPIPLSKYKAISDATGMTLRPWLAYSAGVCSQCRGSGKNYSPNAGKIQPGNAHQNAAGGKYGGKCSHKNCTAGFWVRNGYKVTKVGPIVATKPVEISPELEFEIGKSTDNPNPATQAFLKSSEKNTLLFLWVRVRAQEGDLKMGRLFMNIVSGLYTADMEDEYNTLFDARNAWRKERDKDSEEALRNEDPGLTAAASMKTDGRHNTSDLSAKARKFQT